MLGLGLVNGPVTARFQTAVERITGFADAFYDHLLSTSYQTNAGSVVAADTDPVGLITDLTGNAPLFQASTGRRPLKAAGGWAFDGSDDQMYGYATESLLKSSAFTLPDLSDSVAGKGFTGTGPTMAPNGTLWVANDGRSDGADVTYRPGVVNMTTLGALITEHDLSATFPAMTTIQGTGYDDTDDSIFLASTGENLIRQIDSADGSSIGSFASTAPNGLTIDTVNGHVIVVSTGGTLTAYSKAGVSQYTYAFEVCDCIWLDNATRILYYAMEPATGTNYIGRFHLDTRQYLGRWVLPEATALEGLVIDGTEMFVTNDSYFHGGTGTNQVLKYDLEAVPSLVKQTEITFWSVFSIDAAPSGTRSVVGFSSAGVTNAGIGMHAIGSSTTGIRVFANTSVGTTQRSFVDFTGLPDLTTPRAVVVKANMTAETVDLWVDGVAYGGTKSIPNIVGGISTELFSVGGSKFVSDEMDGTGKTYGFMNRFPSVEERSILDDFLATRVA